MEGLQSRKSKKHLTASSFVPTSWTTEDRKVAKDAKNPASSAGADYAVAGRVQRKKQPEMRMAGTRDEVGRVLRSPRPRTKEYAKEDAKENSRTSNAAGRERL